MGKRFNITGTCFPQEHYMVDISGKLMQIAEMIDRGGYFTINRARQYGKTTTLRALQKYIQKDYTVFRLSFEGIGDAVFENEDKFSREFLGLLLRRIEIDNLIEITDVMLDLLKKADAPASVEMNLSKLSEILSAFCSRAVKPVVLFIDEVDKSSNNQLFLSFLGMLRSMYLERYDRATFKSVVLAGVYDVKNLQGKVRDDREHKYNSPWNIAVDFNVEMSFNPMEIATMLTEYEEDRKTGMDSEKMSQGIYDYTSGYPYLVSRLCQIMDEELCQETEFADGIKAWTQTGLQRAVKIITEKENLLFDDIGKKLSENRRLNELIQMILLDGAEIAYVAANDVYQRGIMFGLLSIRNMKLYVSNRIFETVLYNKYISENELCGRTLTIDALEKPKFISGGKLDMELVLKKFQEVIKEQNKESNQLFLEENGRFLFLVFLKPIINGVGNYYVEARTRNNRRTDVIVDYLGEQYIVELKVWRGEEYNKRGEMQIADYLDYYHKDKGYLVSFNFNQHKQYTYETRTINGKTVVEIVV